MTIFGVRIRKVPGGNMCVQQTIKTSDGKEPYRIDDGRWVKPDDDAALLEAIKLAFDGKLTQQAQEKPDAEEREKSKLFF